MEKLLLWIRNALQPDGESVSTFFHCHSLFDINAIIIIFDTAAFNSELISDNMNEVSLRILDLEICKQAYEKIDFGSKISKGMICAGRIAGGVDTCSVNKEQSISFSFQIFLNVRKFHAG